MGILVLTRARIAQVLALVTAIVAVLIAFDIVDWTTGQGVLVGALASSVLVLILAIQQHFRPNTAEEPVAIAGSVTATASSTVALLVGFQIVHWSDQQIGVALGLVAVLVTLVGSWAAREAVTAKRTPGA